MGGSSRRRVALVTDSTALLRPEVAALPGVVVVPLQVVVDDVVHDEGDPEVTPARVAAALKAKRSVSTSRPAPAVFADLYRRLAAEGADEILAVHLSGEMSGTFESALVASRQVDVPVTCLDTRQVGVATGYAVESALLALQGGADVAAAREAARERAAASTSLFYVDTLEYLRRGGRVGTAAAVFGGALAVKPLLTIDNGRVAPREKVRTTAKALARLESLAGEAAGHGPLEVCVAHLTAPERALRLAEQLAVRFAGRIVPPRVGVDDAPPAPAGDDEQQEAIPSDVGGVRLLELGGVLGAHVGPGMLAICVAPVDDF